MKYLVPSGSSLALLALGLSAFSPASAARREWTEDAKAFRAGTLGNSGQNLYVNRHGALEVIHRYDIDADGKIDLLTNSGHDMYYSLSATLARARGKSVDATELDIGGSSRVVAADLNRDGFTDLVFQPNVTNIQYAHRSSLKIAWGGADGWSSSRITRQLPVDGKYGAEDNWTPNSRLDVADVDRDGWPDILTLNSNAWMRGQPDGRIVRTYWGGEDGYKLQLFDDLGIEDAIELVGGTFGEGKQFCAAVLTSDGRLHYLSADRPARRLRVARTIELPAAVRGNKPAAAVQCMIAQQGADGAGDSLWIGTKADVLLHVGTAANNSAVEPIKAAPAARLAIGRLDGDALPDLVLIDPKLVMRSSLSKSHRTTDVNVFWGRRGGIETEGRATISIPNAISAAVGDLDSDGHGDLLVSVYQGETTMKGSSFAYFGDGTRRLASTGVPIETEGAQDVVVARARADLPPTAVFANSMSYTLDSAVPALLYWGTGKGFFKEHSLEIANLGGLKSSLADLNSDGHPDLILINGGDVTPETLASGKSIGANIYWGGTEGSIRGPGPTRYDASRRQVLQEPFLCAINMADLDRDGFLDVVLGAYEPSHPDGTPHGDAPLESNLVIYYGAADGYPKSKRKAILVPGRSAGCIIADVNRDAYLDIVAAGYITHGVVTFWGGPDGYSRAKSTNLYFPSPIELETADFNSDGWLDLVVSSYYDSNTHHRDTGMSIFWGSPKGWHQSNSQWLQTKTAQSMAVADLDDDGFLDLVSPHYHAELSREFTPSYIYWGSKGGFSLLRRTHLAVDSGTDALIADFDGDGKQDIALTAHSTDVGHRVQSPIFFNDGNRFAAPKVQYIPVIGPFYGWEQDIGNLYDRSYDEHFESQVVNWSDASKSGRVQVDAATPLGSRVEVQVRSGANADAAKRAAWRPAANGSFSVAAEDRHLQYRLRLVSANGDAYPIVRRVGIVLE